MNGVPGTYMDNLVMLYMQRVPSECGPFISYEASSGYLHNKNTKEGREKEKKEKERKKNSEEKKAYHE